MKIKELETELLNIANEKGHSDVITNFNNSSLKNKIITLEAVLKWAIKNGESQYYIDRLNNIIDMYVVEFIKEFRKA